MRDLFEEMKRMQEEMDTLFNSFFKTRMPVFEGPKRQGASQSKAVAKRQPLRMPVCDVRETDKAVIAKFELPGTGKEDIDLNVTENSIEVRAKRKVNKEFKQEDKGVHSYMSTASEFYRRLPLPAGVDADKTVAICKDGILNVTMPKLHPKVKKGKRIDIK